MSISMIGLDTAKAHFQVHGVDEAGKAKIKRTLRRGELIAFFEAQLVCTVICCANTGVVLEACGAAHHREAIRLRRSGQQSWPRGPRTEWPRARREVDRTRGSASVRETR